MCFGMGLTNADRIKTQRQSKRLELISRSQGNVRHSYGLLENQVGHRNRK